jgi:quinol monooxygenase YgiN
MRYGLLGTLTAQPGTRDQLAGHLLQAAELLARNPDCIAYVVCTPDDDADAVSVFEVWTDEAAHDASLEPDDIRALIQRARPLIAGMSGGTRLTVLGGKGVPA